MKKYVYYLMLISFICSFFLGFNQSEKTKTVFTDDGLNSYVIVFKDGIDMNVYKELFDKLDSNNYVIFDFALEDRYHDKLNREIDNIKISKGDYLSTLKEYIEKYVQILDLYNKELEIARIHSGNIRIKKIYLNCTRDIYNILSIKN